MKPNRISLVTFFSSEYCETGIVMLDSAKVSNQFDTLYVISVDDKTTLKLRRYNWGQGADIRIIELVNDLYLSELFHKYLEVRTFAETLFTLKPVFIDYLLGYIPTGGYLFYADADLYFRGDMMQRISLINNPSLVLSKHLFRNNLSHLEKFGLFNAGLVGFRNDETGRFLIRLWVDLCKKKCSKVASDIDYADQKYLENLASSVSSTSVAIVEDLAVNQSLWAFNLTNAWPFPKDFSWVNGNYCFHFHGFRGEKLRYRLGLWRYGFNLGVPILAFRIYVPYLFSHIKVAVKLMFNMLSPRLIK